MVKLIAQHLAGIVDFSGREQRKPFWLWATLIIGLGIFAMTLIIIPSIFEAFARIERFAAEHPDQVIRTVGPGTYSVRIKGHHPELLPDLARISTGVGIAAVIAIGLLAAAVVRRLHDSGRSGAWGLLPLPFLATGIALMPRLFNGFTGAGEPPLGLFFALFLNNLAYLVALGVLVVLLALPSASAEPDQMPQSRQPTEI